MTDRHKKSVKIASFLNMGFDPSTKDPSSGTQFSKTIDIDHQGSNIHDRPVNLTNKSDGNVTGMGQQGYRSVQPGSGRKIRTQHMAKRSRISDVL